MPFDAGSVGGGEKAARAPVATVGIGRDRVRVNCLLTVILWSATGLGRGNVHRGANVECPPARAASAAERGKPVDVGVR